MYTTDKAHDEPRNRADEVSLRLKLTLVWHSRGSDNDVSVVLVFQSLAEHVHMQGAEET